MTNFIWLRSKIIADWRTFSPLKCLSCRDWTLCVQSVWIVDKKDSQRSQGNNSNCFEHMNDVHWKAIISWRENCFFFVHDPDSQQVGNHDIVQFFLLLRLSTSIFIYGNFIPETVQFLSLMRTRNWRNSFSSFICYRIRTCLQKWCENFVFSSWCKSLMQMIRVLSSLAPVKLKINTLNHWLWSMQIQALMEA